ncbi:biotin--[acetyl-CoA-carboxylase] ligase [bacterium]|nr:biotin--[acetyl-CoA-carboxylase] ligase [bacterium]
MEEFSEDTIKAGLETQIIGQKIYVYNKTSSTNDIAWSLAEKHNAEGVVILAEGQIKGRGRLGRVWFSLPQKCILCSIILKSNVLSERLNLLTIGASVAISKAIRETTFLPAYIKWPNDVVIRGKKVCGILVEKRRTKTGFIVIGFGINVNLDEDDFPRDLYGKATSLKMECAKKVSRVELVRKVLFEIEKVYLYLKKGEGSLLFEEWKEMSSILGKQVRAILQNEVVEGQALGIDPDGALILRLDSGISRRITEGTIEYVICR